MLTLSDIRQKLIGRKLTRRLVTQRFNIPPTSKGKWGLCNERLLDLSSNSSHEPDLGRGGELKTLVVNHRGKFRESMKICTVTCDPLEKLANIVLVVARDSNGPNRLVDREVRNESVIRLKPSRRVLAQLEHDRDVLRTPGASGQSTHFLEVRPAGRGGGTEAYYIRLPRLSQYVDEVALAQELPKIRRLVGLEVTETMLRKCGFGEKNKGRYGQYVRSLLRGIHTIVRTGPVDHDLRPLEDLLVCESFDCALDILRRSVYLPMQRTTLGRKIVDARPLAPTDILARTIRSECARLRRGGSTMYLSLKPHHFAGKAGDAFYLRANKLCEYLLIAERP
jgi:hypothetical protein